MPAPLAAQPGFDPYASHPDTGGLYEGLRYGVILSGPRFYSDTGGMIDDAKAKALANAKAKGATAAQLAEAKRQLDAKHEAFKKASVFSGVKNLSRDAKAVGATAAKGVDLAAKGIVKVAEAPINLTNKAIGKVIPGAEKALNKAFSPVKFVGKTVVNAAAGVVKGAIASVTNPNLDNIVSTAQSALKAFAPVGLVASGALGAMKAGLQGKSAAEIAWAAAEGASPPGIDAAVRAAHSISKGGNVLNAAIAGAAGAFLPSSPEKFGFDIGIETLKKAATKEALGVARKALPSEGARRAFDAAVGVVGSVATKGKIDVPGAVKAAVNQAEKQIPKVAIALVNKAPIPSQLTSVINAASKGGVSNLGASNMRNLLVRRANSIPNIVLKKATSKLSAVPSATNAIVRAVTANPALLANSPQMLAQGMRTNSAAVNDAMKVLANRKALLPWRSMPPHVVSFIRKYAPQAPLTALRLPQTDIGGLDATGTVYIVEKGDGPWAIAQKLTGNGNRWKELLDYNKDKKPTIDKNVWVGETINLPPSWQKPTKPSAPPAAALPAPPLLVPVLSPAGGVVNTATSVVPSILQAKAILAAWGKTDGVNQAGVSDYGLNPADMSTTMGPRDTLQLQSFQSWDNKTLGNGLPVDGNLDAKTLTALQTWASNRASSSAPSIPGGAITVPATPATPQVVVTIPTGPIGGTDSTPKVTPATPVVASPAKPATGGSGAAIAIGAVVGGLLFGVPGALIGAAGGAAVS